MTSQFRQEPNHDDVRFVTSALLETFDKLVKERDTNELPFVAVLMGFHNAYKRVILELEKQSGEPVREYAVTTLRAGLPEGTTGHIWDTQVIKG